MDFLNDPEMKEIINDFYSESSQLLVQMEDVLENLEEAPGNTKLLEDFGQLIDRIMGAAKSIGADEIAHFCELGKIIGYKSSQTSDIPLLNVVIAILFDTVDLLNKMLEKLNNGDTNPLKSLNTKAFVTRLKWLSNKFKNIERASCSIDKKDKETKLSQDSIDSLLEGLGL